MEGLPLHSWWVIFSYIVIIPFATKFVILFNLICIYIKKLAVTECCERLAYYGMSTNLVNYLKIRLHQDNVTASNNVTNWSGTCYITPLIGAFLADSYLGRYCTIATFSSIYVLVSFQLLPYCIRYYKLVELELFGFFIQFEKGGKRSFELKSIWLIGILLARAQLVYMLPSMIMSSNPSSTSFSYSFFLLFYMLSELDFTLYSSL